MKRESKTVLVVDDEARIRTLVKAALGSRGFGVGEFRAIGEMMAEVLDGLKSEVDNTTVEQSVRERVIALTSRFPMYS